jgi:hypothetical protein
MTNHPCLRVGCHIIVHMPSNNAPQGISVASEVSCLHQCQGSGGSSDQTQTHHDHQASHLRCTIHRPNIHASHIQIWIPIELISTDADAYTIHL